MSGFSDALRRANYLMPVAQAINKIKQQREYEKGIEQLAKYFNGTRTAIDDPYNQTGTEPRNLTYSPGERPLANELLSGMPERPPLPPGDPAQNVDLSKYPMQPQTPPNIPIDVPSDVILGDMGANLTQDPKDLYNADRNARMQIANFIAKSSLIPGLRPGQINPQVSALDLIRKSEQPYRPAPAKTFQLDPYKDTYRTKNGVTKLFKPAKEKPIKEKPVKEYAQEGYLIDNDGKRVVKTDENGKYWSKLSMNPDGSQKAAPVKVHINKKVKKDEEPDVSRLVGKIENNFEAMKQTDTNAADKNDIKANNKGYISELINKTGLRGDINLIETKLGGRGLSNKEIIEKITQARKIKKYPPLTVKEKYYLKLYLKAKDNK